MQAYPKNKIPVNEVKKFIVIFYMVGTLGFIIPYTKQFFILITPFALLVSTYLLLIYHGNYLKKDIVLFTGIGLCGYFIEVIGVKTGLIFGNYFYGETLGIKILETPLMIGINWLFLTYASTSILQSFKVKPVLTALLAPMLMLIYDLILEQAAPKMGMWQWEGMAVPLKNYIAWYIIGLIFVAFLQVFKVNTQNSMSKILFICQFIFFVLLTIFYK